jgi:hypothetical protein
MRLVAQLRFAEQNRQYNICAQAFPFFHRKLMRKICKWILAGAIAGIVVTAFLIVLSMNFCSDNFFCRNLANLTLPSEPIFNLIAKANAQLLNRPPIHGAGFVRIVTIFVVNVILGGIMGVILYFPFIFACSKKIPAWSVGAFMGLSYFLLTLVMDLLFQMGFGNIIVAFNLPSSFFIDSVFHNQLQPHGFLALVAPVGLTDILLGAGIGLVCSAIHKRST